MNDDGGLQHHIGRYSSTRGRATIETFNVTVVQREEVMIPSNRKYSVGLMAEYSDTCLYWLDLDGLPGQINQGEIQFDDLNIPTGIRERIIAWNPVFKKQKPSWDSQNTEGLSITVDLKKHLGLGHDVVFVTEDGHEDMTFRIEEDLSVRKLPPMKKPPRKGAQPTSAGDSSPRAARVSEAPEE